MDLKTAKLHVIQKHSGLEEFISKSGLHLCQPRSQAVGKMAWQLLRVQTVYGYDVTVIAIFHSNSLVHVILTIFPAVRMGLSCYCLLSVLLLK